MEVQATLHHWQIQLFNLKIIYIPYPVKQYDASRFNSGWPFGAVITLDPKGGPTLYIMQLVLGSKSRNCTKAQA